MLRQYLSEKNISLNECGKLVVATESSELHALEKLYKVCVENNIEIYRKNAAEVASMEPNVKCLQALWSPKTAVLDVPALIDSLEADATNFGVTFVHNCKFLGAKKIGNEFQINTDRGEIVCSILINSAGLWAPEVASKVMEYPMDLVPKMFFAKGSYFKLKSGSQKIHSVRRLVYPLPGNGGLGIHATIDVDGSIKFGPDIEYLFDTNSGSYCFQAIPDFLTEGYYNVDETKVDKFCEAIKRYYPSITVNDLQADYSGIRPKLRGPNMSILNDKNNRNVDDFLIECTRDHGIQGFVNIFGIESPGLTSCLPIAEFVLSKILK